MTLTPGGAATETIERRWTEDELTLAFFDYSACTKARCAFKRVGGCHCVTVAYHAVNMIKHVLPRSLPLAATPPLADVPSPDSKLEAYRKALEPTHAEQSVRERLENNGRNEANKNRGVRTGSDLHLCEMLINQLDEVRKALAAGG